MSVKNERSHDLFSVMIVLIFTVVILNQSRAYAADTTAPITTPSTMMGTYNESQNIALLCDDGIGSGCAATYYCLGRGCLPTTSYSGPIVIGSTTVLNFFSQDMDGNSEQVKSYEYTIDPSLIMRFERLWPQLSQHHYLYKPAGLGIDAQGNIYVADKYNNRIDKFDANGTLLAQWGSKGQGNGQFNYPSAVAVDAVGNVYVADTYNNRIQKFDSNGSFLVKWGSVGAGDGQFDHPVSLAIDINNNLFTADDHRIQKFNNNGDFLTKWGAIGPATGQFQSLGGVAVDSSGYVYTTEMNRIQKFTNNGTFVATWGQSGLNDGQIQYGKGIVIDTNGDLIIADALNKRIQKFNSSGLFLAKWGAGGAGDGQFGFSGPSGIVLGGDGKIYVTDPDNNRIEIFDHNGTFLREWHSKGNNSGQFDNPQGVAIDLNGNVYVTDYNNNRIQKFTVDGSFLLQWGGAGNGNGQFDKPCGVAVDANGNVFVVDKGNNRVQKFDGNGNYLIHWGQNGAGNGEFRDANGIAVDNVGNVFVTDTYWSRVQKFDNNGSYITQWDGSEAYNWFTEPTGVAVDGSGNVYVLDTWDQLIQKFTNNGSYLTQWGTYGVANGQFALPKGIAADSAGNIYVTDTINLYENDLNNNKRVQKFDSSGNYLTQWGRAGTGNGEFNDLAGIAVTAAGDKIFVADSINNRVQKFVPVLAAPSTTLTVRANVAAGNGAITSANPVAVTTGESATYILSPSSGSQLVAAVTGTCPVGTFNGSTYTTGIISSECSVSFSFADATPPETTITLFPTNPTDSTAFTFAFNANEAGATFECSLDNGAWQSCSSPLSSVIIYNQCIVCQVETTLNFAVRAKDSSGNINSNPATYSWTVNNPLKSPLDNVMNGGMVNLKSGDLVGDINLNRPISFALRGGWDTGYLIAIGQTTIHGSFTISSGTVTVEGIVIM